MKVGADTILEDQVPGVQKTERLTPETNRGLVKDRYNLACRNLREDIMLLRINQDPSTLEKKNVGTVEDIAMGEKESKYVITLPITASHRNGITLRIEEYLQVIEAKGRGEPKTRFRGLRAQEPHHRDLLEKRWTYRKFRIIMKLIAEQENEFLLWQELRKALTKRKRESRLLRGLRFQKKYHQELQVSLAHS